MTTPVSSSAPAVASVDRIREDFPALDRRQGSTPVAYFDGPGGTQVPRPVVEAMGAYLFHHNANTHWAYPSSEETDAALDHTRRVFADFFNADPGEIVFGANMTTLTYHVSRGLGRSYGPGDEIVVTELDHHANIAPWTALAQERRLAVRIVPLERRTGRLAESWERSIGPRTKVVAVGAASNALGTINPVREICARAHAAGALVYVDGVHFAPHVLPDVHALDCDFFVCSPYKFYGPHVGVLYGRRPLLETIDFPKLIPAPDTTPERAETGTLNHEGVVGAAAAVEWLASLSSGPTRRARLVSVYDHLRARGDRLLAQLWEGLESGAGCTRYGPPPDTPRTPTAAFTLAALPSRQVAQWLAGRGVFCSHGDFYARTVIERLELRPHGVVRAGCACYTTEDEVDRLLDGVRTLAAG